MFRDGISSISGGCDLVVISSFVRTGYTTRMWGWLLGRIGCSIMHHHPWYHAVAQLVEAQRYKPVVRGFDSRWCHWIFSLT
jgi:hypothetical protein